MCYIICLLFLDNAYNVHCNCIASGSVLSCWQNFTSFTIVPFLYYATYNQKWYLRVIDSAFIVSIFYSWWCWITTTVRPLLSGLPLSESLYYPDAISPWFFFFLCTIITGKRGISNSIRIPTQTHMNYRMTLKQMSGVCLYVRKWITVTFGSVWR